MKKKQLIAALASSTLVLSTAGTAFADEVTPLDPTTPSTEVITPAPSSQPEQSTEPSTSTETGSTTEPTVPVDPTSPSSDVTEVTDDNGVTTDHTNDSGTQTENSTEPSEEVPNVDDAGGVVTDHTVPTTDGGTATVTPDTSVPTNNPNISAETAANAGASQVGTTSTVTGQIVQDVTTDSPVYTNTGATIVSTQNDSVVLADGTITSPESIGATTNSDGTISVTTATGESTTLPMTGDENTTLLSILGSALATIGGLFFKKRQYFN
ncbi:LPXTG cell wall anchor domain-containing protein [Streptococcus pasteurianus]|nr:LPXTG cell wall anchor domain-containing protein [Streptococcus pasteurianus]